MKKVLINLSNHPSSLWSEKQKEEAKRLFGEIVDIKFPLISPNASSDEVLHIAYDLLKEIESYKSKYEEINVHIMGEFSLTVIMVQLLYSIGIRCFVSTTDRKVKEEVNEKGETVKTTVFDFVRFREYKMM